MTQRTGEYGGAMSLVDWPAVLVLSPKGARRTVPKMPPLDGCPDAPDGRHDWHDGIAAAAICGSCHGVAMSDGVVTYHTYDPEQYVLVKDYREDVRPDG